MTNHVPPEKIHDLLDGLATAAQREEIEVHVASCGACRDELARMTDVVMAIRDLPSVGQAPEGIWDSIEARISGTQPAVTEDAKVLALPVKEPVRRRFHFTVPQLAAAALLVSLLSSASVWMALSGTGTSGASADASGGGQTASVWVASLETDVGYAQAVSDLEMIVEQGRNRLAPETVAALDQAMQNIDAALAEVRRALEADPSSGILGRMLANHQMSRLRLLRQAASAVQAVS
jgi:anti-sigma factor RsiW